MRGQMSRSRIAQSAPGPTGVAPGMTWGGRTVPNWDATDGPAIQGATLASRRYSPRFRSGTDECTAYPRHVCRYATEPRGAAAQPARKPGELLGARTSAHPVCPGAAECANRSCVLSWWQVPHHGRGRRKALSGKLRGDYAHASMRPPPKYLSESKHPRRRRTRSAGWRVFRATFRRSVARS